MLSVEKRMEDAFSRASWLFVESLRLLELPQHLCKSVLLSRGCLLLISPEDELQAETGERMRWILNLQTLSYPSVYLIAFLLPESLGLGDWCGGKDCQRKSWKRDEEQNDNCGFPVSCSH